jgi:hypothetical protein
MTQTRDFWSRRRAAVEAEDAAVAQAAEARALEAERDALEQKDDAEILAELNLPDPDTLALGDDVRGFMAKTVPDRLRRRALRQLWRLNPVLANVDGLVDYGEDFTDSATVIENLQTAYQVGKGMLAHIEELARQAEEKANPTPEEPALIAEDTTGPEETPGEPELSPSVDVDPAPTPVAAFDADPIHSTPVPRRMRFEFQG